MIFSDLVGQKLCGFYPLTPNNGINPGAIIDDIYYDYRRQGLLITINQIKYIKHMYLFIGETPLTAKIYLLISNYDDRHNRSNNGIGAHFCADNFIITKVDDSVIEDLEETFDKFKYIGETISEIWTDGDTLDKDIVIANYEKWKKTVGVSKFCGEILPAFEKPYVFMKIITKFKTLELGAMYHSCHYPETIWNLSF